MRWSTLNGVFCRFKELMMKNMRGSAAGASGLTLAAGLDMQDGLWEITTKVSMEGMPMTMPGRPIDLFFQGR